MGVNVSYKIRSTVNFLVFAPFISVILGYITDISGLVQFGKVMLVISIALWLMFSFIGISQKKRKKRNKFR